jgi:hypothetical protein
MCATVMKQLVLLCCPLHATVGLGYCGILVCIFFYTILACFLEALTFRALEMAMKFIVCILT